MLRDDVVELLSSEAAVSAGGLAIVDIHHNVGGDKDLVRDVVYKIYDQDLYPGGLRRELQAR
jgi:hypothetical protein